MPDEAKRERLALTLLALCLAVGTLLRVIHLASHRFHVDEALFAAYGLAIASGDDPLLAREAVDKPPLFFYLLALAFKVFGRSEAAAAVPSLVASLGTVALVYFLCRRFFDIPTALLAAFLMAISPFNVAYAYTAFIDPTMVGCALLAAALAERRLFFFAGLCAGLLPALKAQGVLFLPLIGVLALFGLLSARADWRRWLGAAALFLVGAALPLAVMWQWSNLRPEQPPFLELAAAHNPLVLSDPATYSQRLMDWWSSSLQFMASSPLANYVLVIGLPLLLAWDLVVLVCGGDSRRAALFDWTLALFGAFFIAWHTYYETPAWERYLLGLVPVGLILLSRALILPWRVVKALPGSAPTPQPRAAWSLGVALAIFLSLSAPGAVHAGLRSTYALGWAGMGGPSAYLGIEDVAAFLRANVDPDSLLFDYKTLSWHYKYYVYGLPYKVIWFDDKLLWSFQNRVLTSPAWQRKYIVMPDWVDDAQTRARLAGDGVDFREVYRTYRPDGSVSFTVYELRPVQR